MLTDAVGMLVKQMPGIPTVLVSGAHMNAFPLPPLDPTSEGGHLGSLICRVFPSNVLCGKVVAEYVTSRQK